MRRTLVLLDIGRHAVTGVTVTARAGGGNAAEGIDPANTTNERQRVVADDLVTFTLP